MSLHYGLMGEDWRNAPPDEIFRSAKDRRVPYVELISRVNFHSDQIVSINSLSEEYGIRPMLISGFAELNTDPGSAIPWIREQIQQAKVLGAPYCGFLYGGHSTLDPKEGLNRFLENLMPLLELASQADVTLLVETVFNRQPNDLTATVSGCRELLSRVHSDNFGLLFDPCNLMIAGTTMVDYGYEYLKRWIKAVHIKDVRRHSVERQRPQPQRLMVDCVEGAYVAVPLGQGQLLVDKVLAALNSDQFSGPVIIEQFCECSELSAFLDASVTYLQGLAPR